MKKQYIVALLLLIGVGVISTMAFSTTALTSGMKLYEVSDAASDVTVTSVDIAALGTKILKVTIHLDSTTDTDDAEVYVTLLDEDGAEIDLSTLTEIKTGFNAAATNSTTPDASDIALKITQNKVLTAGTDYITLRFKGDALVDDGTPDSGTDVGSIFISVNDATVGVQTVDHEQ